MKKVLILLGLLISFALNAQDYQLYKTVEASARTRNENGTWGKWEKFDVNMVLRLDIKNISVEFNNNAKTIFYATTLLESKEATDDEGDKYTYRRFAGYDQDGAKCHVVIIDWLNLPNTNFRLEYSDIEAFFATKIL